MTTHRALAIRLRWEINEEGWRPGMRLPSIIRLAETHAVSASTVVRAIRILVDEGLVEVVHGRGVYILGEKGDRGLRADRPRDVVQAHVVAIAELAQPGHPIPSPAELAHICGTSAQTVYRVLRNLVRKGVLRRAGQGVYL
jgi:GntR family transcriptional regulator